MATALKAIDIIETEDFRRQELMKKTNAFKIKLIDMGFKLTQTETPILPVLIGDPNKPYVEQCLMEDGILYLQYDHHRFHAEAVGYVYQ